MFTCTVTNHGYDLRKRTTVYVLVPRLWNLVVEYCYGNESKNGALVSVKKKAEPAQHQTMMSVFCCRRLFLWLHHLPNHTL